MFPNRFCITNIDSILYIPPESVGGKIVIFQDPGSNGSRKNPPVYVSHNQLIFHLSGKTTVRYNGKVLRTKTDTLRFLPDGEMWEYIVDREEFGPCIDISFQTDTSLSKEAFTMDMSAYQDVRALFEKILTVWTAKAQNYYLKSMSLLYKILMILFDNRYNTKDKFKMIEPAVSYISKHYTSETISIPHLASLCRISTSYLKKMFVTRYGLTPKKYITKLRMDYAVEMLSSRMYTVSAIAEILGYENVYYFSKVFKEELGLSPNNYLKKCLTERCAAPPSQD